ncbi:MAG TPA: hypothetical protein VG103_11710, partial [Chthoniobacterales bacterium]|nr:hypothetical protein [Chthoniobacterales bacterium]
MSAVAVFRMLLLVRGCWSILEWFFDWGSSARIESLKLLHPYLSLFAGALGEALFLGLLVGLWFFHRWARSLFVLLLALAFVYSAFRPYHPASLPPSFVIVIMWLMVMLHGAIVAMSFLPPVRDM